MLGVGYTYAVTELSHMDETKQVEVSANHKSKKVFLLHKHKCRF